MNLPLPQGSSPPEPDQQPPATSGGSSLSRAAVASFILGLLIVPLNIITGLPALLLGYRGLYAINASEGRLRGRFLAIAGMALGSAGCLIAVAFGIFLLFLWLGAASARTDCANNLRQMGAAIESYQLNHDKTYPQATIPNPRLPPEERLSWMTALLREQPSPEAGQRKRPYLEKTLSSAKWHALMDSIDLEQGWQAPVQATARSTRIPTFLCLGNPNPAIRNTPGLTDYVGLSGAGLDAASLPRDDPQAGFFGYDRTVTFPQVSDRQSYTMIVTETTIDNGPWIAGGPATVRGVAVEEAPLIGRDRPFGGCHFDFTGIAGLNTLWLDGSVRYFTDSRPAELFARQTCLQR